MAAKNARANLHEYRRKRNLKVSGEPDNGRSFIPTRVDERHRGGASRDAPSAPLFVIQEHHARRLHYDLRIEAEGVLKSWAVPKMPVADPAVKRLAVRVEDHPMSYAAFEGVIPPGQYGAGEVKIWDHGTWTPPPEGAVEALRRGKIKFTLHGERLTGDWELVRMQSGSRTGSSSESKKAGPGARGKSSDRKENWLLFKLPQTELNFIEPQLATLARSPPEGKEWTHEIKFDGYRVLAAKVGNRVTLWTRNGLDWTEKFSPIAELVKSLNADSALIDGELVCNDSRGVSEFALLQEALRSRNLECVLYYAFDLLHLNGRDLRHDPLRTRKRELENLLAKYKLNKSNRLRFSSGLDGDGPEVFAKACQMGLEGTVSKRLEDPYLSGRWTSWLKNKCTKSEDFVVGGYTPPSGSRRHFGALLVGAFDPLGRLTFRGRIGTGFSGEDLSDVMNALGNERLSKSPFDANTSRLPRRAHWVPPRLVIEAGLQSVTRQGNVLRHGVFKRIREDKNPRSVTTMNSSASSSSAAKLKRFTNQDKVLFPKAGVTKSQIAEYYMTVGDLMWPELKGRPLALVRCPDGIDKECFFQKRLPPTPAMPGIVSRTIDTEHGKKNLVWLDGKEGLISLAQLGVIEIHCWQARVENINHPDQIVFDLDPDPSLPWKAVRGAALALKDILDELKLESFPLLTGGKGIHVRTPLSAGTWKETKNLARSICELLSYRDPGHYILQASKSGRKGRVFLDYLRNGFGATAIAPYSLRARPSAPVAMPVTWKEVKISKSASAWTIVKCLQALRKGRSNPWKSISRYQSR